MNRQISKLVREDPATAAERRQKELKRKEEAVLNAELKRMSDERSAMSIMANRIVSAIDAASLKNDETSIQDIQSPEQMENLILKSNATRQKSLETLKELSEAFVEMKTSATVDNIVQPKNEEEGESELKAQAEDGQTQVDPYKPVFVPASQLEKEVMEQRERTNEAMKKLNKIFSSGQKEYNDLVMSMASSFDDGAKAVDGDLRVDGDDADAIQEALIPMLQKKLMHASHALEMATMKADTMGVQIINDKALYIEKEGEMQRKINVLEVKLQVASAKKRFAEQIERDPNMVPNVVSSVEYEEALGEAREAQEAARLALEAKAETEAQFAALKTKVYEAERSKADDKQRIKDLEKENKAVSKSLEAMEELKAKTSELESSLSQAQAQAEHWKIKAEDGTAQIEQLVKSRMTAMHEKLRGLEGGITSTESSLATIVQAYNARIEEAVNKVKRTAVVVASTVQSTSSEIEGMKAKLAEADARAREGPPDRESAIAVSDLAKATQTIEDMRAEVESLRSELSASMDDSQTVGSRGSRRSRASRGSRGAGGEDEDYQPLTQERVEVLVKDVLAKADKDYDSRLKESGLGGGDNQVMQAMKLQKYSEDVIRKTLTFGNSLCEMSMSDEDIDELIAKYAMGLFDQIGEVALQIGPASTALAGADDNPATKVPTPSARSHDDDDVSVLTAESMGFDAGEDDEEDLDNFRNRELTAEETTLLEAMKEALTNGDLQDLGSVRKENFDRLRGKTFGGEDLIDLTIMEHNLRYDDDEEAAGATAGDAQELSSRGSTGASRTVDLNKKDSRRQKMQLNMMSMLQEQSMAKVIENYNFSELARFKTETERNIRLLRSFSALQAIKYYHDGGNFMDVLTVHRDIIDRAIRKKGGWPAAMEEVRADTTTLSKDALATTDHWPEFFRVKVLEFYKKALQSQQERFQLTMDLFQQKSMEKGKRDAKRLKLQVQKTEAAVKELEDLKAKKRSRKVGAAAAAAKQAVTAAAASANSTGGEDHTETDKPVAEQTPPSVAVEAENADLVERGDVSSDLDPAGVEGSTPEASASSHGLLAPKPVTPVGAREQASQALAEMGLDSKPSSSNGEDKSTTINDSLPPTAGNGSVDQPVPSAFMDMLEGDEDDLMADRIIEEDSQMEIVDRQALVDGRRQLILDAMKAEEVRIAEEVKAREATLKLTPEQAEIAVLLHPAADAIVMQAIEKDPISTVVVELMLHVFDSWKEGFIVDAAEELEEALAIASTSGPNKGEHSSMDFCRYIYTLLELDTVFFREAREVHDKFEALLAYFDRQQADEPDKEAIKEDDESFSGVKTDKNREEDGVRARSPPMDYDRATSAKSVSFGGGDIEDPSTQPRLVIGTGEQTSVHDSLPLHRQLPIIGINADSQDTINKLVREKDTLEEQNKILRDALKNADDGSPLSPNKATDRLITEELRLAETKASVTAAMEELENQREHMEVDRKEFLDRRENFAVVKADVEARLVRLKEEEEALKAAKEKQEHDMIWIDVQKEKIEKELTDIAHLKAEPHVPVVTHDGAMASQKAANIKKQLTSKDKADMMIAAADKMVEDVEKQKEIFQEEMDKELSKLRSEKQVIAREKISQMKLKAELLKRENAIVKDRAALDADREKFDLDVQAYEEKSKADRNAFETYRAKEEKRIAEDIDRHSRTQSLDNHEGAFASKRGGGGALAKMMGAAAGASHAVSTSSKHASPLAEVQLNEGLSETLAATHLVAKLALKRRKKTEVKKSEENTKATVEERVKEEVEIRLAKALAMIQKDQIEVGVQTMTVTTTLETPSMKDSPQNAVDAAVPSSLDVVRETGPPEDFELSTPSFTPLPPQMSQNDNSGGHFDREEMLRQQKYLEMHLVGRASGGPLHPPPGLPPGFHLVYCEDGVLELCPGVTYASYGLLEPWELEKVPPHIVYARRGTGEAFTKGIRRLPRYVPCPRVKACEAVILPREGLEVAPGVKLVINSTLSTVNMELPVDVHVAAVDIDANLPPGMTRVNLHPTFNVAQTTFTAPKGLELVQCNFSVMLPPGTHISKGCTVEAFPPHAPPMPRNLMLVRRLNPKTELPDFLVPTMSVAEKTTDLFVNARMSEGCTIVKRPFGLRLGPGMELMHRSPGHALPAGVKLVPVAAYPEALRANPSIIHSMSDNHVELVRLPMRLDLPPTCCFDDTWYAYPRPAGMRLPPNVGLYAYEGSQGGHGSAGLLPACLHAVPMPNIPYGVAIPPNVLAAEMIHSSVSFLPPGTRLAPGLIVEATEVLNPSPAVSANPTMVEEVVSSNDSHFEFNEYLTLVRRIKEKEGDPGDTLSGRGIPPLTTRAGAHDYPTGILLEEENEMIALHVRYEVPAGVKLGAGVVLGEGTQLSPGTVLNHDMEVVEWPHGTKLAPGTELVRLAKGCSLPQGYSKVVMSDKELVKLNVPDDCIVVKLPHHVHVSSLQQLAEKVSVVDPRSEIIRRKMKLELLRTQGLVDPNAPNPFDRMVKDPHTIGLSPGMVLTRRTEKNAVMPCGMTSLGRTELSAQTRRFLASNPGGSMPAGTDSKAAKRPSQEQPIEVAQLDASHQFPFPGVQLAQGLFTLPKPLWLKQAPTTQWVELVSKEALDKAPSMWRNREVHLRPEMLPADEEAQHLKYTACETEDSDAPEILEDGEDDLTLDALTELGEVDEEQDVKKKKEEDQQKEQQKKRFYALPEGTVLICMPRNFQVFGWGEHLPGVEVVTHADVKRPLADSKGPVEGDESHLCASTRPLPSINQYLTLPLGHFYVSRTRKAPLPPGLRDGLAKKYEGMGHYFRKLPPGVSIIHIEPTYSLPRGCNMESTVPLQSLPLSDPAKSCLDQEELVFDKKEEEDTEEVDAERAAAKKKRDAAKHALERQEREKEQAAYDKRMFANLSFHGLPLTAAVQISAGQQLGAGLHALPHPHGWLSSDNPWLYPETASNDGDVPPERRASEALVFAVAMSKTYKLPEGTSIHPESEQAVKHYFSIDKADCGTDDEKVVAAYLPEHNLDMQVILLRLAEFLQAPRELLREDLDVARAHEKDGAEEASSKIASESTLPQTSLLDRVRSKQKGDGDIDIHITLRNPILRDPPDKRNSAAPAVVDSNDLVAVPTSQELAGDTIVEEGEVEVEDRAADSKAKEGDENFYDKLADLTGDTGNTTMATPASAKPPVCKHCGEDPGIPAQASTVSSRPTTSGLLRLLSGGAVGEEKEEEEEEGDPWERDEEGNLLLDENGSLIPKTNQPLPTRRQLAERLEMGADEIHDLEVENNALRMEIKDLKYDRQRKIRRLAVFAFRQQNRDRNFRVLRDEISDLKAQIVKRTEIVKLKAKEVMDVKQEKRQLQARMQAQITVLNRQVATWADVGEDVKRERHKMLLDFEERRRVQQRYMTDLYSDIKVQTTKYLQLVVANMCFLVSNLYKDSKLNSAKAATHLVSLQGLTDMARKVNKVTYGFASGDDDSLFGGSSIDAEHSEYSLSQASEVVSVSKQGSQDQSVVSAIRAPAVYRPVTGESDGGMTVMTDASAHSHHSQNTSNTTRDLHLNMLGDIRNTSSAKPPPTKGFRKTNTALSSQPSIDSIEDHARSGAVSPLAFDEPDIDDDVSMLSMDSLAHGDVVDGGHAKAVPVSMHNKQPLASRNQALLLKSNSDLKEHRQGWRGALSGSKRLGAKRRAGQSREEAEREFVGMASAAQLHSIVSSASTPSLQGGDGSSVSSASISRPSGGGSVGFFKPASPSGASRALDTSASGSVGKGMSPSKLKPLAKRAPGASLQTFMLSSPPASASGKTKAGPSSSSGVEGQVAGVSQGGDIVNMIVPINPFLSSSREEGTPVLDSGLTASTDAGDLESMDSLGAASHQSFDLNKASADNEEERESPANLTAEQHHFKMRREFSGLMLGLEKAVIASNVHFINALQPHAPAVVSDEPPDLRKKVLVDIYTPPTTTEEAINKLNSNTTAPVSRHVQSPPTSSLRRSGGEGHDQKLSVSFAEAADNDEKISDEAVTSDVEQEGKQDGDSLPSSFVESVLDVSNDPSILPASEELFESLMGTVRDHNKQRTPAHADESILESILGENGHNEHECVGKDDPSTGGEDASVDSVKLQNHWLDEAKRSLRTWRKNVEQSVLNLNRRDSSRYTNALSCAESEMYLMVQSRRGLERRVAELEKSIVTLQLEKDLMASHGEGYHLLVEATNRERELRRTIDEQGAEIERLRHAGPFQTTNDFMRAQGDHALRLKAVQQTLRFQAMVYAEKAAKEEARITLGSGSVQPLDLKERKAVQLLVRALKHKSKVYDDRARYAGQELNKVLKSVLSDLEAFEQAIKSVLPQKSIIALLRYASSATTNTTKD